MKAIKNKFTLALGTAFLVQAFAPLISGAVLFDPMIDKSDIERTMVNLAQHPFNAQLSIFLDIVTVMGIVWLGVLLFDLLKKINLVWATTGLAFYILEAIIHFTGKIFGYALIRTSDIYFTGGEAALLSVGQIFLQVEKFFSSMAMIPFGIGAILLYYALFKSKALPAWLMVWGLISVFTVLIGIPLIAYGVAIPFAVVFPYVPFEFFTGGYILIKGLREKAIK